jgi:anti-anti-sigma regulatory factor
MADPDVHRSPLPTPSMRAIVHVILPDQADRTRTAVVRARALAVCPPGARPGAAVTVDFTATARLDPAGARQLRELARTLGARGYRVRAVGAREPVRDLMRLIGADAWMPFTDGASAGGASEAAG